MSKLDAKTKADGAESASTDGLGVAAPPAPTFDQGGKE